MRKAYNEFLSNMRMVDQAGERGSKGKKKSKDSK